MKTKIKLILCAVILLGITALVITNTYALFETNANGNADFQIGKWVIKLNNRDITLDKVITLDDFVYVNSEHVEQGYFAPSSKAEYEVDIDANETDVSVEYLLNIDDSDISEYPNINFKILDLVTNEEVNDTTLSGIMYQNETNKTKRLKLVLEWINDGLNDETDTSLIGKNLSFKINIDFKQYLGE